MTLITTLALAAAALGAAGHPTPKVVLVKHADFIRQTLPGARQYFVRTVTIGKEDLATIRQASDFTPDDPDVQFYLGQGDGGTTVGVVLFQQIDTPHGPIEVGLTLRSRRRDRQRRRDDRDGRDQAVGAGSDGQRAHEAVRRHAAGRRHPKGARGRAAARSAPCRSTWPS